VVTSPRRGGRAVAAVSLAVVTAAGGAAGWWSTHPSQSFPGGYGMGSSRDPGQTFWTSLVHSRTEGAEEVVITGLVPRVEKDTSGAEVDYLICVLDTEVLADERIGGFMFGGRDRDVDHYCSSTRPAVGSTLHLRADPPEELIVGITPTRPGRSVVADHRIDFRVGWQRGHATIDVSTTIRSPQQR
jgi:hypothetical protein